MRISRIRRLLVPLAALLAAGGLATPATASPPAFDPGPAAATLARLLPRQHDQIRLRPVTRTSGDHFRVTGSPGRITVEGTSPAVLLTGIETYLHDVAHADISWDGDQLNLPAVLPAPAQPVTRQANVPNRFALNDTDDGYTGPYRSWADWEHEIDVLALHGINEVLITTGEDEVYRRTFAQFGYSDAALRAWIPAPAHQPWWLLQNMSSFGGPVSDQLLKQRTELAQRIVGRLRELGITPVLPGYFGTVPPDFPAHVPGARVIPQGTWGGFTRPDWLDPRTPAFARVAESFYRNQKALFGDSSMYKMDLLHEGGDPGDVPVGDAAKAVESALRQAHPGAIWCLLGWQSNPRPEILDAVDKSRLFIVDGLSDRYPTVTDREQDWHGTPYAFGSIWNFGGHTAIGANTPDWVSLYPQWRDKPGSELAGIAMMPEGADNNPAAMALLTDLAWTPGSIDLASWFTHYADYRYGGTDPHAEAAWQILRTTAYGTTRQDSSSEAPDSLFDARPSLDVTSAAAWSPGNTRYDTAAFDRALTELLQVAPRLRGSSAYRYDLVDVARQALSNRDRVLLPQLKAAYQAKDRARFDDLAATWLHDLRSLDALLGTDKHFLLGPWLADARAAGATPAEKDQLEFDARSVITVWGDRASAETGLHDYANREWSGLVGTLYTQRWQTYFASLDKALATGKPPAPIDWFAMEDGWAHGHQPAATHPSGDSYSAARHVAADLAADPHQGTLASTVDIQVVEPGHPATLTASFTNHNGFAATEGVQLTPEVPDGLVAKPLTPSAFPSVAPGATVTARWQLGGSVPGLIATVPVTARFRGGRASAATRLMSPTPIVAPDRTVSANGAHFGESGDNYAIEGGGADMWGAINEFGALYRPGAFADGASVTTTVTSQDPTGPWARAGLVVRNSLSGGDQGGYLDLGVTPSNGCVLSWDSDGDGHLDQNRAAGTFTAPVTLRLTRHGGTYLGECSTDGRTWTTIGTAAPARPAAAQDTGLFMTAANGGSGARGIAGFTGFAVTG